ncbi:MAG: tRNA glutamyl-Q(34) synthetase GluQRS [Pseudomonadota bacterium]
MVTDTAMRQNHDYSTRFAPSPTGLLHLGHAFSALSAFDAAVKAGGKFILRIEDTDLGRCRPEFTQAIFEDLAWLGIEWELPVRHQSEHFEEYTAIIEKLLAKGVLYPCFKTRKEMEDAALSAPHGFRDGIDGVLTPIHVSPDEEAARLANGEAFAWRLSAERAADMLVGRKLEFEEIGLGRVKVDPFANGDVILARKDNQASYHLCAVHDDALQGISHIIRGEDLKIATHIQVILQALLGYSTPTYHHHQLILDENGKRFAKRDKAQTLRHLRETGVIPEQIRERLGLHN